MVALLLPGFGGCISGHTALPLSKTDACSTHSRKALSRLPYLVNAASKVISDSTIGWSGLVVLFCRFTIAHNRTCSGGNLRLSANDLENSATVDVLSTRCTTGAEGSSLSRSQLVRSKPWCDLKLASVTMPMLRYRCCSSRSFLRFSIAARSSFNCLAIVY